MRYLPLICLLLFAIFAWGQEQSIPSNPQPDLPPEYRPPILRDNDEQKAPPASASKVASDAGVITIKGLCAQTPPSAASGNCQTVITRAQFEKLTEALLTNMKFSRKRQLASAYPDLLAMAREAEARGLENSPRFQERLAFARVQILSQELIRQIDEQSAEIPEKDLEDYYHSHAAEFESAVFERIFIPNHKRMDPLPKEKSTTEAVKAQRKEAEDAMIRLAEELHARAVAGDAFMSLQKEAYASAGMTDVPPNPSLGQLRASGLPPGHASVFDLKPGEVSPVLSDSTGHYIYKVDSKENESFEAVKDEIHKMLENQRRDEAIQAIQRPVTTEFNPAYFGQMEKHADTTDSKSK
jgi:PPIC-type PPIASE domain